VDPRSRFDRDRFTKSMYRVQTEMSKNQNLLQSGGDLLRRLDKLSQSLQKARTDLETARNNPSYIVMTGELEARRTEARYCFADIGSLAEDLLREVSAMEFRGSAPPKPRSKAEWRRVMSGGVLPPAFPTGDSDSNCTKNIGRLIELVEIARKRLEGGLNTNPPLPPNYELPDDHDCELPNRLRKGLHCELVIKEVRQIKQMANDRGMSITEIKKRHANFTAWKLAESLSDEDREIFAHPSQWGPPAGYARKLLAHEFGRSPATIVDWVKNYRRYKKGKAS
jgi:hypothetical protein